MPIMRNHSCGPMKAWRTCHYRVPVTASGLCAQCHVFVEYCSGISMCVNAEALVYSSIKLRYDRLEVRYKGTEMVCV